MLISMRLALLCVLCLQGIELVLVCFGRRTPLFFQFTDALLFKRVRRCCQFVCSMPLQFHERFLVRVAQGRHGLCVLGLETLFKRRKFTSQPGIALGQLFFVRLFERIDGLPRLVENGLLI